MRRLLSALCLLAVACGDDSQTPAPPPPPPPDAAAGPPDAPAPIDGGMTADAGVTPPDGNGFTPGGTDPVRRPLTPISVTTLLAGSTIRDIAVDTAGNAWATTDHFVLYLPRGGAARQYSAADGLALGDATTFFAGVGAGRPGQAFIGTLGKYFDVVDVQPNGSLRINHVYITHPEHVMKVTMAFRFAVDLDDADGGTVWIGAEHGHAALHGINQPQGYCFGESGCFEEHRHSDPSGNPAGDVKGLAVCPNHEVWTGDAWWVARMPWAARGAPEPDFWSVPPMGYPSPLVDVFPNMDDGVYAIVCDPQGNLWVGSYGGGMAYIDSTTLITHYFAAADSLPQNLVTALVQDADGSIWVGTSWGGLGRYQPQADTWTYYGMGAGLPTDTITALAADLAHTPRTIYIGTFAGLYAYRGP